MCVRYVFVSASCCGPGFKSSTGATDRCSPGLYFSSSCSPYSSVGMQGLNPVRSRNVYSQHWAAFVFLVLLFPSSQFFFANDRYLQCPRRRQPQRRPVEKGSSRRRLSVCAAEHVSALDVTAPARRRGTGTAPARRQWWWRANQRPCWGPTRRPTSLPWPRNVSGRRGGPLCSPRLFGTLNQKATQSKNSGRGLVPSVCNPDCNLVNPHAIQARQVGTQLRTKYTFGKEECSRRNGSSPLAYT
ncbi:hypothetical protein VTG60DRAFT_497 [Thermothelomyces hinnuleus]